MTDHEELDRIEAELMGALRKAADELRALGFVVVQHAARNGAETRFSVALNAKWDPVIAGMLRDPAVERAFIEDLLRGPGFINFDLTKEARRPW